MTMEQAQSTFQRIPDGAASDDLPGIRPSHADKVGTPANGPLPSISHLFASAENPSENPLAANRESSLGPIRSRPLSSMAFSGSNHFRHEPPPQTPQSPRWLHRTNTSTSAFTGRLALRRLESSGSIASVASGSSSHESHITSPVLSPLGPGLSRHRNPTAAPASSDYESIPQPTMDDQGRRGSVTRRHTVGAADVPRSYVVAAAADLKDSSSASECGFERSGRAEDILSALRSGASDGRERGLGEGPLTPTGRSRVAAGLPRPPMDLYNPFKANQVRSANRKRGLLGEHGSAAAPYGHRGVPSSGGSVYSHTSSLPSLSISTASTRSTASASVSTTSLSSMGPSSQSSWSVHSRSSTLDDLEVHLDAQHLDPNYERHPDSPGLEPKPFLPPRSSSLHLRNQAKREAEDAARRDAFLAAQELGEYERQDSPVSVRSAPQSWGPTSPRFGHNDTAAQRNAGYYQQRPDSFDVSHEGMHQHNSSLFALANAANAASARGAGPRAEHAPTPRLPLRMSSRVDGQLPYRDWEPESQHYHTHSQYQHHSTSPPLVSSSSSAYSVLSPYSSSNYRNLPPPSIRSSTSSFPSPHGSFISLASAPAALPTNQHYGGPPPANSAKYECATCGKRFTRPSSLKIHMHSHTGERPFGCSCGRKFSVHSNLRRHQKAHGHVAATGLDEEVLEADAEEADAEAEAEAEAAHDEGGSPHMRTSEEDSEHTPTEEVEPKSIGQREDDDTRMRSRSPSPIDTYTSPSTHSSAGIDVEFEDAQTGLDSASSPEDHQAKHFRRSLGLSEELDPRVRV